MSKPNLTDLDVRNAHCPDGKKIKKYHDGAGLYLWCLKDGGRWWRFRFYVDGKEKTMGLGAYPSVSLAQARVKARAQRDILEAGTDPAVARKKEKAADKLARADSFEAVAKEWYESRSHMWAVKHRHDVWKRLEQHVFPTLGKLPVSQIEAPDLIAALRKVQASGASGLAFRVLGNIRQILDFAINSGRLERNVATGREGALKVPKPANHAHVSTEEFPELIRKIATYDNRKVALALQLISMVFTRANELLQAEWSEFDFDNKLWEIPASRMKMEKALLVPLAPQVIKILDELKDMNPDSKFVFPGRGRNGVITSNLLLNALKVLGYGKKQTVHGFRHIASTILNEARHGDERLFDPDAIEAQLAHTSGGTRAVYNKARYLPERRRIMCWWASYLEEITKKGAVDN